MGGRVEHGTSYVAVIGIDRYRSWPRLRNAVCDARGALDAFVKLGFVPFDTPLVDGAATRAALSKLVNHRLRSLGRNDSLVVFFAGHGHTLAPDFSDNQGARRGYLIPTDAEGLDGDIGSWLRLDSWLKDVAHLPPRHIFVILDACHSGIALDPDTRWRSAAAQLSASMDTLRSRRSRRVLTSALDDEVAMDGGPISGHSLFTGCLIEALGGELFASLRRPIAAASELWSHVRSRVSAFASQKNWPQTPEFGRLDFDDHGELVVQLPDRGAGRSRSVQPKRALRSSSRSGARAIRSTEKHATQAQSDALSRQPAVSARRQPPRVVAPTSHPARATLDPAFVATLDRHDAERRKGASVLSVVVGDADVASAGWAAWAAGRGSLTLMTEHASLDATVADLLAQVPWLRSVRLARARLADAARLPEHAVDAALDARSESDRRGWIDEVAHLDRHVQVSGWLLSELRQPRARVPNFAAAPVRGGELLSVLCDLAAPISVLLHRPDPDASWFEAAIRTAAVLVARLPRHAIAVAAPGALVTDVLRGSNSAALSMARQGLAPISSERPPPPGHARSRAERALHDALHRDPRTAGRFALNVQVAVGGKDRVEVDLLDAASRLAVEIDGWFHFRVPQGYRRDRAKDVMLQRAGYFVMRFLAEDVDDRLAMIVDEIAIGVAGRRAAVPQ